MSDSLADWTHAPVWNSDLCTLRCVAVVAETHDVTSFFFQPSMPARFAQQPGQFITLELEIDGREINRSYTLSATPTRPYFTSITVKRQPGGIVSNWLHDHLQPGMEVRAIGPSGNFTCASSNASKILFLSGGSGITPVMSMSRSLWDMSAQVDMIFIHNARSPADLIFRDELKMMSSRVANFEVHFICDAQDAGRTWQGQLGYLDARALIRLAPDLLEREIYCCGPAPYMANVRAILGEFGFDMGRYFQESFVFEDLPGTATQEQIDCAAPLHADNFTIRFDKLGKEISCGAETTILQAAKANGIFLPYGCALGLCGTCKSAKLSGEVEMKHGGGIRQSDIDKGFILPCCSRPRSNVVMA